MIFFIIDTIQGNREPIAISAKNSEGGYYKYLDFLNDAGIVKSLAYNGEYIYLKGKEGFDYVYPICDHNSPNSINFSAVAKVLSPKIDSEIADNVYSVVATKINAQIENANFSGEDIKQFFEGFRDYVKYKKNGCTGKIDFNPEYIIDKAITLPIIDRMNIKSSLSYLGDENKTLFMNTPEDEVYIKLPAYEQLGIDEDVIIPKPAQVLKAYDNKELYTMKYRDYLGSTPIEHVVGNVNNNDMPIQENEKRFYNAMKELIEYGIKQNYPNNTLEECIESGYDDVKVTNFLTDLAMTVASWNWAHTGNYPVALDMFDDDVDSDDDDNDSSSQDEATYGRKRYHVNPLVAEDNTVTLDAEYLLKDYISKATEKNIYAPAEAVIKLLRWGNRKPSRLKIDGMKNYLNLNNLKLENTSGSYDNLEPIKTNGATFEILGVIKATDKFKDISYLTSLGYTNNSLNIPVGVIALRTFKGGIDQYVLFTIPSMLKYLENHEGDIEGITITNDKVITSLDINDGYSLESAVGLVNSSSSGERIFFREEELIDMYMEYQLLSNKTSYLSVLEKFLRMTDVKDEIATKSFKDSAELMEKYSIENNLNLDNANINNNKALLRGMAGLKDYFDATLASQILPIVLDVAQQNYEMRLQQHTATFEDILNCYMIAMEKYNFSSRNCLSQKGDLAKGSTGGKIADDLNKMSSFGQSGKQEVKPHNSAKPAGDTGLESVRNSLFMDIPDDAKFVEVTFRKYDASGNMLPPVHIGYISLININGKKKYLFVSEVAKDKVTNKKMNANQILKIVMRDYYYTMQGKPEYTSVRYVNSEDWLALSNRIKDVVS